MTVLLRAFGLLKRYLGEERQEIELAEGATLKDLMDTIDSRWGRALPPHVWDSVHKQFHGSVIIMLNNKAVKALNTPLADNQEVLLLKAVVGG